MANWIKKAIKHPGALTRQAKRASKTVSQYIANPPKGIKVTTKRRIALAKPCGNYPSESAGAFAQRVFLVSRQILCSNGQATRPRSRPAI